MRNDILRFIGKIVIVMICMGLAIPPHCAAASELAEASARGEVLVVRRLLEEGADADKVDEEGYTALLRAVFAGSSRPLSMHFGVISLLLNAGADVNASVYILSPKDYNPVRTVSALHRTVSNGAAFLELSLLLLENGADPNLLGAWGKPLHIAAGSANAGADEVRLLLDWGADPRAVNQWGVEPLVKAVTASNPSFEKIALLLEAGSDIDALFDWNGHYGLTVLMAAAMNGTSDIVRLLLYNGAQKFSQSDDGLSAYDYAVKAGRADNAFALR